MLGSTALLLGGALAALGAGLWAGLLALAEEAAVGEDFFSLKTLLAKGVFRRRFEENKKNRASHRVRVRLEAKGVPGQYVITQSPFLGSDDTVRGAMLFIQEAVEPVEAGRSA